MSGALILDNVQLLDEATTPTKTGQLLRNGDDPQFRKSTGAKTIPTLAGTTLFTAGSVPFITGSAGELQQDNANIFWDNTNKRLGLKTAAAPTATLQVNAVTSAVANTQVLVGTAADANKGLVVQGFSGTQSGNLIEGQDSAGNTVFAVKPTGDVTIATNSNTWANFTVLGVNLDCPDITSAASGDIYLGNTAAVNGLFMGTQSGGSPRAWIQSRDRIASGSGGAVRDLFIQPIGGNLGIGTSTTIFGTISLIGLNASAPAMSGTGNGAIYIGNSAAVVGLFMGTQSGGNPHTWIQARDTTSGGGGGALRNVYLQPIGGFVGIGTTSAVAPLTINTATASLPATSGTAQGSGHLIRLTTTDSAGVLDIGSDGTSGMWIQSTNSGNLATNYILMLNPNGGNVGVNKAVPLNQLHVYNSTTCLVQMESGSTEAGVLFTNSGTDKWQIYKSTNASGNNLYIYNYATSTVDFSILSASGYVGVGMTTQTHLFQVNSNDAALPTATLWTVASDERLKENISLADLDRCYEIVKNLPLKRFTYKDSAFSKEQVNDRSVLGWVAQDVKPVLPKAVSEHSFDLKSRIEVDGKTVETVVETIKDCLSLNASQIIPAMYGAVQNLMKKVEALEAK